MENMNTKEEVNYHLVIVKNDSNVYNNLPSHSVFEVADCFVNPLLKDIADCLRELSFGRPTEVQEVLREAMEKINELEYDRF